MTALNHSQGVEFTLDDDKIIAGGNLIFKPEGAGAAALGEQLVGERPEFLGVNLSTCLVWKDYSLTILTAPIRGAEPMRAKADAAPLKGLKTDVSFVPKPRKRGGRAGAVEVIRLRRQLRRFDKDGDRDRLRVWRRMLDAAREAQGGVSAPGHRVWREPKSFAGHADAPRKAAMPAVEQEKAIVLPKGERAVVAVD